VLGLDLLTVANEGKLVAMVAAEAADQAVAILRDQEIAAGAAVIGTVGPKQDNPLVEMLTTAGGRRVVQMPYGEELPRIC
jgi:hydrogenase expression/formation protein HypE